MFLWHVLVAATPAKKFFFFELMKVGATIRPCWEWSHAFWTIDETTNPNN